MITIHQIDADDRALLSTYSDVDTASGEAFADPDCVTLVEGWRRIAEAEIARHARHCLVQCVTADGFSLHRAGATDDEIAAGKAPYLVSGPGRPSDADYAAAWMIWAAE